MGPAWNLAFVQSHTLALLKNTRSFFHQAGKRESEESNRSNPRHKSLYNTGCEGVVLALIKLASPARLCPQQLHQQKQAFSSQPGVEEISSTGCLPDAKHRPGFLTKTLGTLISKLQVGRLRLDQLFKLKIKAM